MFPITWFAFIASMAYFSISEWQKSFLYCFLSLGSTHWALHIGEDGGQLHHALVCHQVNCLLKESHGRSHSDLPNQPMLSVSLLDFVRVVDVRLSWALYTRRLFEFLCVHNVHMHSCHHWLIIPPPTYCKDVQISSQQVELAVTGGCGSEWWAWWQWIPPHLSSHDLSSRGSATAQSIIGLWKRKHAGRLFHFSPSSRLITILLGY